MMIEKIRQHVEILFESVPVGKSTNEIKEEMITNLTEKYNDLVRAGKTENEAFAIVISSIGDISEIVSAPQPVGVPEKPNVLSVVLLCTSVFLYFVAGAVLILFSELRMETIGLVSAIIIAGIATAIIIFKNAMMPKKDTDGKTMVGQFKEWSQTTEDTKNFRKTISSILWPIILCIYFAYSFIFGAWAHSWIIFIAGAAVEGIINAFFSLKK